MLKKHWFYVQKELQQQINLTFRRRRAAKNRFCTFRRRRVAKVTPIIFYCTFRRRRGTKMKIAI